MANTNETNDNGRRWATITIYRECEINHSPQTGCHAVDGCLKFLGFGDDPRSKAAFYCSTCGCNRNFHRKEEANILVDPLIVRHVHELAAIPPHRGGTASPTLPPQPPQVPVLEVFLGDGDAEQEERMPKRQRTNFTEAQKRGMKEYAERLGWRLRGRNEHELSHFCLAIGVTMRNFKLWMSNNKKKYNVEDAESSTAIAGL